MTEPDLAGVVGSRLKKLLVLLRELAGRGDLPRDLLDLIASAILGIQELGVRPIAAGPPEAKALVVLRKALDELHRASRATDVVRDVLNALARHEDREDYATFDTLERSVRLRRESR